MAKGTAGRFASPFSGPLALRRQMRHILYANKKRRLRKIATLPPPPSGFVYLLGADGAYLLGADGAYLLGAAE